VEDGRFGEFVQEIISSENKRKQAEAQKEEDRKLWELYLHSASDKSFRDWKDEVLKANRNVGKRDADLTNDDVHSIIKHLFKNA
jgi:hypothetical protein